MMPDKLLNSQAEPHQIFWGFIKKIRKKPRPLTVSAVGLLQAKPASGESYIMPSVRGSQSDTSGT